tara:strand:+ start:272 stop:535 length:264 start_codon:yes stop_codon:yes gene_type:complete
MIKAMLIVAALGGYTTEMPSMDACLKARDAIAKQNPEVKTLCVPKADETTKMKEMFGVFLNMIDRIKEYEEIDRLNNAENRQCEDCT